MHNKDLFNNYNHLGFFNPFYYVDEQNKIQIDQDYGSTVKNYPFTKKIDTKSISEVLSNRFMLGDRTLLEGIKRSPWLAKPNVSLDGWEFYDLKKHQELVLDEKEVGKNFFRFLCAEIKNYVGGKKKIGVLLSGGMDSRIVAGCLDYLIKNNEIEVESVTAYNWGHPESRDVVYAKEIANRLGWNYKHYLVNADSLWENFKISGLRGAEYSGIHLHAIPQIKFDVENEEVLLVGSYGDSIGRGEYEGIKVANLTAINKRLKNFGGFIKSKFYDQVATSWENDINTYHKLFPEDKDYQQFELDFQLHYMRRMLNPCMEILNEVTPTFQIFTSPKAYQYMWSLHPNSRNDKVYTFLMDLFKTKLNDIPWARTGIPYLGEGKPDSFTKKHHNYFEVIESDLILKIEKSILSGRIDSLNIFNMTAIRNTIKLIKVSKGNNNDYLERLSWFVSLDYFLEKVDVSKSNDNNNSFLDFFNGYIKSPMKYLILKTYRSIKS